MHPHLRFVSDWRTVVRTVAAANGLGRGPRREYIPGEVARDVARLHASRIEARVVETRWEAPDVKTLRLRATTGPLPPFLPGQYVTVAAEIDGVRIGRPLSISSSLRQDTYEVTVKDKPDGFVSPFLVRQVHEGDILEISGPEGELYFNSLRDTEDLVFVAAGTGIAPFAGMIEHLLVNRSGAQILLLYGCRDEESIIFRERLENLSRQYPDRFRLVITLSRPTNGWLGERGRVRPELLTSELDRSRLTDRTFFLCGPADMNAVTAAALESLGAKPSRIRREAFGDPREITLAEGWPETVAGDRAVEVKLAPGGEAIAGISNESLLVAMERAGIAMPAACRSGTCGTCRCRVLSGEVYSAPTASLRQSDRDAGVVHACAAFPVSDVVLEPSRAYRGRR